MSYTHNILTQKKEDAQEAKELLLDKVIDVKKAVGSEKVSAAAGLSAVLASACSSSDDANYSNGVPVPDLGPGWKSQFILDPSILYMNVGTQGSLPTPVINILKAMNEYVAYTPFLAYGDATDTGRKATANAFGCDWSELTWSFNTTGGLSFVIQALKWEAGDDLITTDQEHSGGLGPMHMLKNKHKVNLHFAKMPNGVKTGPSSAGYSDDDVMRRLEEAYAKCSKPKAILFSSPSYKNGIRLPEKRICEWAASKGMISIIDGAHLPGSVQLNFHDMGCDFFSGAGHKWQCGPGQTGVFYVRNGIKGVDQSPFPYTNPMPLPLIFPSNENYRFSPDKPLYIDGKRSSADDQLGTDIAAIGNINYPSVQALAKACMLWDEIGRDKIEHYAVGLAQYLRACVVEKYGVLAGSVDSRTNYKPSDKEFPNELKTGLTNFSPFNTSGKVDYNADLTEAQYNEQVLKLAKINKYAADNNLVIRMMQNYVQSRQDPATTTKFASLSYRVTTHLFNDVKDVQKFMSMLDDMIKL